MSHRRSPDATRRALQETALDLFLRQGYDATTLAQIAAQHGITRPAILYHFHHKEDLLRSLVEPALDAVEHTLAPFPTSDPLDQNLQEVVLRALLKVSLTHRPAVALMSQFTNDFAVAGLGERVSALNLRCVDLLAGPGGGDRSQRLKAVATLAALGGVMGARVFVPIDTEDEASMLLQGLLALLRA